MTQRAPAAGPAVGIVANPASGRDIRRLVARASVFPAAEKAAMVQRMLGALGLLGVDRVLMSTDLGGISAAVLRAADRHRPARDGRWPRVEFCVDDELTDSAADTTNAVRRMVDAGVGVVVCLGGDGTARVAAGACGDVPLLPLSTGTNNAFPDMREATVAGLAAGLLATGRVEVAAGTRRPRVLEVLAPGRRELAMVDVAASTSRHVGARALWDPASLTELYCTFAEPDAIGLSSVPGLLCPAPRTGECGVALRLAPPERAATVVYAPIAPGLVLPVGVVDWRPLRPGEQVRLSLAGGVVAVDGERDIELRAGDSATVRLRSDGPRCVDVAAVMAEAARRGVLCSGTAVDVDAPATDRTGPAAPSGNGARLRDVDPTTAEGTRQGRRVR